MENFVLPHMPVFDCCKVYIFMLLLASEAGPQWGGGWKTLYCHICLYLIVVRYIYIFMHLPYVHNLECTRKILRARLERK